MKTTSKNISIYSFLLIGFMLTLTSCVNFKEAGRLNMVSVRNIDTDRNYQLLKKNVEYTKKELRKTKTTTIESAIDDVVKKVEGGEYLMNARIRVCVFSGSLFNGYQPTIFYAVEGDVWGILPKK